MSYGLPQKPRLRHSLVAEILPPAALFLLDEHRQFVFEGEIYPALAPLLNGENEFGAILASIGTRFSPQEIFAAIGTMMRRGCLVDAEKGPAGEHGAFWEYLQTNGHDADQALSATAAEVLCLTDIEPGLVEKALHGAGMNTAVNGDLLVVVTDDYHRPELKEINARALADERPWVLIKPVGMIVWVGPLFKPRETACWQCLQQRIDANRQAERYIRHKNGADERFNTSRARLATTIGTGLNLAATEIARSLITGDKFSLANRIVTLDISTLKIDKHTLVRRPQCPACGSTEHRGDTLHPPIELQHHMKIGHGNSRSMTADETFETYKHHISPITGIVSSFQTREKSEYGLTHNYVAGHYFPMVTDDMNLLRVNAIARSGGKGSTEIQAKTSALCESIERYSGVYWGDEPTVTASYDQLSPNAVHIREFILFSDAQYAGRKEWNERGVSDHHYVPDPLEDDATISWTPAWSLTKEKSVYVPTAYCFYGHRDPGQFFCKGDSNGAAAGNTLEEAIIQGFLEIVERDSVALWWYNRVKRPLVDVDSFDLAYWHEMTDYYQNELDRDIHVLDITADLGIPAFAVVSRRRNRAVEDIVLGFSAHLDPKTAMLRALGEANQYLPALRMSAPDGSTIYQLNPGETIDWWKTASYQNQPYLVADTRMTPRCLDDYSLLANDDVMEDVLTCVNLARTRGLDILVVNQTRPDIGLPVAKVIVPGMRHFWRRLAPGRLYDVPVQLGWRDTPLTEDEINPISCFV